MRSGFTLLEVIVYFSVIVLFIPIIVGLIVQLSVLLSRNNDTSLVIHEGNRIMNDITRAIRNASSVENPLVGYSSSSIRLEVDNSLKNPTLYRLFGTVLETQEGSGNSFISLSSSNVLLSSLTFSNVGIPNTKGSILIDFTVSRNMIRQTFHSSATLHE